MNVVPQEVRRVQDPVSPLEAWALTLSLTVGLGIVEVLAPGAYPVLFAPIVLAAWLGGRDHALAAGSFAASAVLISATGRDLAPSEVALQVTVLALVSVAAPWLKHEVDALRASWRVQALVGATGRGGSARVAGPVPVHVFARLSRR